MPSSFSIILCILSLSLLLSFVQSQSSVVTPVLLGRGNNLNGFTASCGKNLTKCNVQSSTAFNTPWTNIPFFNLSYAFTTGDWSATFGPDSDSVDVMLDIPNPVNLTFSFYNPGPATGTLISIMDNEYKNYGSWPWIPTGWTNISIPLNNVNQSWLPAGNITFPLRSLSIGMQKPQNMNYSIGWIGIADIVIESFSPPSAIPHPILISPLSPNQTVLGVFVPTDSPTAFGLSLTNRILDAPGTPPDCQVNAYIRMRNSTGPMGDPEGSSWDAWTTCASADPSFSSVALSMLPGWSSVSLLCTVTPSDTPSYLSIQAVYNLSYGSCARVNDTQRLFEMAVAIVPTPVSVIPTTRNMNSNVYGGQMIPSPLVAARISMLNAREGPLWRWAQPGDCWNLSTCFFWSDYDGIIDDAAHGIAVMLDAREIAPPWAAAKNNSGPTWAEFPGPEHYADYVEYLTIMFNRYGPYIFSIEVSNEDDGLAYFQPQPISLNYSIQLSLDLINLTIQARDASPATQGLPIFGLSTSGFDIKQLGNGGSEYLFYERAVLGTPGILNQINGTSPHPYQNGVFIPWLQQPWGNISFNYPNETMPFPSNSTVGQLLAIIDLMNAEAQKSNIPDYVPVLQPSEFGYAYAIGESASSGWAFIHAACITQGLLHIRSLPLATYVKKAFVFAADDGCCPESNGYYGMFRPGQVRTGQNASSSFTTYSNLAAQLPLPAVSTFATAAWLTDVSSNREAGIFILDNTLNGYQPLPGQTQLPPTCIAFEASSSRTDGTGVAALFITGHHYNDRTIVTSNLTMHLPSDTKKICWNVQKMEVAEGWMDNVIRKEYFSTSDSSFRSVNGLGTPMTMNITEITNIVVSNERTGDVCLSSFTAVFTLTIAPLPQYVITPSGVSASSLCGSLSWS